MAITIISRENASNSKQVVRVEMHDGTVHFFKVFATLTNAQVKNVAQDAYYTIKEAARLQRRSDRIVAHINMQVKQLGLSAIAEQEIDAEGVV